MRAGDRRKHLASLERRRVYLAGQAERRPQVEPVRRELAAVTWAIRIATAAVEQGIVDDLAQQGLPV